MLVGENTEVLCSKISAEMPQNRSSINRQRPQPLPSGGRQQNDVASREFLFKTRVRRSISNPHEVVVEAQSSSTSQHEHEKSVLTDNYKGNGLTSQKSWTKDINPLTESEKESGSKLKSASKFRRHPLLILMPTDEPFLRWPETTTKNSKNVSVERSGAVDEFKKILSPIEEPSDRESHADRTVRQVQSNTGEEKEMDSLSSDEEYYDEPWEEESEQRSPDANKLNNEVEKILTEDSLPSNSSNLHEIKSHGLRLTDSDINNSKTTDDFSMETQMNRTSRNKNEWKILPKEIENMSQVYGAVRNSNRILVNEAMETDRQAKSLKPLESPSSLPESGEDSRISSTHYSTNNLNENVPSTQSTVSYFSRTTGTTRKIGRLIGGQCECFCPCLDVDWSDDIGMTSAKTSERMELTNATTEFELSTSTVKNVEEGNETRATVLEDLFDESLEESTAQDSTEQIFHANNGIGVESFFEETTTESITISNYDYTTASAEELSTIANATSTDEFLNSTYDVTEVATFKFENSTSPNEGCPVVTPPPPMILILEGENAVF